MREGIKTKEKIWLKNENGDLFQKECEYVEIDCWEVRVLQQRDYDWTFNWSWTFDNEQDAIDKVRHIHENWKEYPIAKYGDHVWYYRKTLPIDVVRNLRRKND